MSVHGIVKKSDMSYHNDSPHYVSECTVYNNNQTLSNLSMILLFKLEKQPIRTVYPI